MLQVRTSSAILRAGVVLAVAAGAGAGPAGAATPTAVAPAALRRVCSALEPGSLSSGIVGAVVAVPSASPWRATRRSRVGYVASMVHGRRLTVCAFRGRRQRGVALDLHARLGPDERLVRAAVADPWVAWVTRRRGGPRHDIVHWQRLGDTRRPAAWRVDGRVVDLVPTTAGRVLVQRSDDGRSRFVVLRRGRAVRRVVLRGPAGAAAARRGTLVRWTPTDAAITRGPRTGSRRGVLVLDPDAARERRRCRPSATAVGSQLTTGALRVDLFAAERWAASPFSAPSVERGLEICRPDGGLAAAVLLTRDGPEHDVEDERGSVQLAVAGDVVLVRELRASGISGSGTDVRTVRGVYTRDGAGDAAEHRPALVAAGPAAGAFVEDGALWVSDADGLRRVTVPGSLTGPRTALRVGDDAIAVRSTAGVQRVPVRPLPAGGYAAPPAGAGAPGLAADDACQYDPYGWGEDCAIPATPAISAVPAG